MKVFAIFMIILTFITGFDLCNEDDSFGNKASVESSRPDRNKHHEEEACSPFCNCARCSFSVMLPSQLIAFFGLSNPIEEFDTHPIKNPIQISSTIWQPPRLS